MSNQDEQKMMNTEKYVVVLNPSEENPQKTSSSRIGRYHGVFIVASFLILLAIVIVLHFKLVHDYNSLRTRVDYVSSIQEQTDRKLNNSERHYVNLLIKYSNDSKLRWLRKEKSDKVHGTNHQLNKSLERVKEAVNSFIPALENLRLNLTSLTNSSDLKMRRFGRVVEKLKVNIVLAQNELTHLNVSLHTELARASDTADSSIGNVRKELSKFSNFTASKIGQMITDMNNTNVNIVNMWEMLSYQNSSQHSHVLDTFVALASKVEDADKKLVNLRNFTAKELWQFRNDLKDTQENLGRARKEFVHFNKSFHSLLQGVAKSQSTSVKSINERISSFRKDFESNKKLGATERKSMDEKLSKSKAEFRESLKEDKEATSALEKKMSSKQEHLEEGQNSQQNQIAKLRNEVNRLSNMVKEMKNKAGCLRIDVPLILTSALVFSNLN